MQKFVILDHLNKFLLVIPILKILKNQNNYKIKNFNLIMKPVQIHIS